MGAGRLGTALGVALKRAGYQVEIVVAQRPDHARQAAKAIGGSTLGLSARQLSRLNPTQMDRLNNSSLVLIATPDDAIAEVAGRLAMIFKSVGARKARNRFVAMHTSGALSSEVLRPLQDAGFATGSLHPLVSVSDSRLGAKSFAQAFFSVEGDPAAVRLAKSIVRDLGGQAFAIKAHHKSLYHAAAVMASPHLVALYDIAQEMLARCGFTSDRARQVLLPLMESTIANLSKQNPATALTGTFRRGDVATVRRHLAAMKSAGLPNALEAYQLLGKRSIALARKAGAKKSELDQIERLMEEFASLRVSQP
jgi:predicted short-subunit dehydrogenase-like oxidoreductase (DUF2520 family)